MEEDVFLSPPKKKDGVRHCYAKKKKREKHTWAFLGRQLLRGSTRKRIKVEVDFGRIRKRRQWGGRASRVW